jgi:hypothetical protein
MAPTGSNDSLRRGALSDDSLLIFLHLPKTAGQTFNRILFRQYPRDAVFRVGDGVWSPPIEELTRLPDERKRAIRLVAGHMSFGAHEAFTQPARYIAFVRNPVARMISHYRYVLRARDHYLHDEVASRGMSLMDYVCSGLSPELENGQVKMLVGPDDKLVAGTRDDLELAKRHIREHFVLVGVTERFDESILLLKRALDWRRVGYGRVNVSPARTGSMIDEATAQAIMERNALDIDLYKFCVERLQQEIADSGSSFLRELSHFRAWNRASGLMLSGPRRLRRDLAGSPIGLRLARHLRAT